MSILHKDGTEDIKKYEIVNDQANSMTSLHPIEKKILLVLQKAGDWMSETNLAKATGLNPDQVRRGIEWLRYKNLIDLSESSDTRISLHEKILDDDNYILPERKFVNVVIAGRNKLADVFHSEEFQNNEKEVYGAIRYSKVNGWISVDKDQVKLLPASKLPSREENFVNKLRSSKFLRFSLLDDDEKIAYENLAKRPNVLITKKLQEKKFKILKENVDKIRNLLQSGRATARKLDKNVLISSEWRNLSFEQIDVEAPLPLLNCGRKNPLIDFIDEVKEILVSMGFSEIEGKLIQTSFWNFDALFIPQDHSAREMQDTFYLNSESGLYSALGGEKSLVDSVSKVHEYNWDYAWDEREAKTYVLRTHTTPVTLQHLWKEMPDKDKVFLIGRVFRNEKVTFKHLVEFHQVEGIYTSSSATLRQLIGIQSEFYSKLGIKKVKFWPTFFPYTEPSLQSMVFNDKLNKWIELFGMGIFRSEVTKPLGFKNPVLAWGGGFERLAMLRFGLDDIRELYSNNLSWLKSVAKCQ
ncbi:phenylalanine--tRNA ligase subunit alpha [Candidatus Nitrosocosmicus franklandus]|uniref:phenylalanine--tRNA ligase n=1 Tax=Candidatus Nitrosocosmicus franklandianus TaxID=1798806 RepID=A0A484IAR9_9ARCH|nr:phenylalanine--tRNA ligase subunit alpha [Candidatus Nitrosocosmicus franklandus]VFJ12777.1 Phenylalanine--tRNA ligase alpha subunit [Candidatus Nitrosocosmicus franklandus]